MESRDYISKEIRQVFQKTEGDSILKCTMIASWIMAHFKGFNLKVIDVKEQSSLCDYFLLASVQNFVQAQSMADALTRHLKSYDLRTLSKEGMEDSEWLLIDFGDMIVHIFLESVRDIYDLDTLWKDSPTIEIPSSFYMSNVEQKETEKKLDHYF